MAEEMTLEELKKLNEETAPKEEEQEIIDNLTPDEEEEEAAEEHKSDGGAEKQGEEDQDEEESAENGEKEGGAEEGTPEWAKGEDEAKYTDSDAAAIRRKWKSRLKEADEEKERLKAELEELKKRSTQKAPEFKRPNPDDFEDHAEYQEALVDYKLQVKQSERDSEAAATQRTQEQQTQQKRIDDAVNGHYARAAELAEKSGIKAETYQAADLRVRQIVDSVYPDGGDAITDALIANLGEGSEKVLYHLGVNPSKLKILKEKFEQDKTGLAVASYLGMLKAELDLPAKRKTSAPPPAPDIKGDGQTASETALKKKYQEAHKKGDTQAAFDLKRQAKAKGINTGTW